MREFAGKVASALAPVFGVVIAISILRGADIPFPPPLEFDAWAPWAVFAAVVYACTALCFYAAGLMSGAGGETATGGAEHQA